MLKRAFHSVYRCYLSIFVIEVISHYDYGFEVRILILIAPVPDNYLSFVPYKTLSILDCCFAEFAVVKYVVFFSFVSQCLYNNNEP